MDPVYWETEGQGKTALCETFMYFSPSKPLVFITIKIAFVSLHTIYHKMAFRCELLTQSLLIKPGPGLASITSQQEESCR